MSEEYKIKDDAHYDRSLAWLTERAQTIVDGDIKHKNPIMNPGLKEAWRKEREKLLAAYNKVSDALRNYSEAEERRP